MNLPNFKILTLAVVFFSSISLDAYADEEALSKRDLVEIENRIENMNVYELNERREALIEEAAFLQAEQGSSQSPSRSKDISSRLSKISAELSSIQKALIGLGSIAVLSSLSDDGYDDNVPPVISLTGNATVTVELGTSYTDAGATANDAFHGSTPVTSSGSVNTNAVGSYQITYTATDLDGNTATATRTVNVVDTTNPVVTVTGANPATVELGETYTDAGATATDASGSVTVVTTGTVDTTTVGAYTLTYTSTDASGNSGTATRTVNVVDTTDPVVTVTGDNPATVELGDTYTDAGATATDASGSVTVVTTGTVDTTTVGAYTLTYTSTDASGNSGTATRTVNVTDTTAPAITVTGDNPATVELAGTYTDAGATATDASGDVTVVTTGTVDTTTVGEYTITYTSTDASGNAGTATRTVNVTDTVAPVVTVTGSATVTLELGGTYTDAGATATDASGDVTVVVSGETYLDQAGSEFVDAGTIGTYTITYTSTDASGNAGTATRTVNVVDTTAPVFTSSPNFEVLEGITNIGSVSVEQGTLATKTIPGTTRGQVTFTIDSSDISIGATSALLTFNYAQDYDSMYDEQGLLQYTAVVTATDPSGNATNQTITVNVLNDPNDDTGRENATGTGTETGSGTGTGTGTAGDAAPVITLTGGSTVTHELGDVYTDSYSVTDDYDPNVTVVVSGTVYLDQEGGSPYVDSGTIGTYTITYTATDDEDNTTTVTRTVNVVDTTAPVFLTGPNYEVLEGNLTIGIAAVEQSTRGTKLVPGTGRGIVEFDILAQDDIAIGKSSGILTFKYAQDYDSMYDEEGKLEYQTSIKATDPSGNVTIQNITVNVLNDPNDDTGRENATGTGTETGMGTGTGTGTAGDTAPTITLNGDATVTHELGDIYTDAGATATDDYDPNVTVVVSGTTFLDQGGGSEFVDSAVTGSYTITYTATDSEDNTSTATRTVNVVDTTAPVFTSSNVYSVLEGISNIGSVAVQQNTRATRHNPVSGDGRVTFSIVNDNYDGISANAISIDSSSALLTFNITTDYDSMYNNDDGSLDFTATVTATDASGNATDQRIFVTVLNDGNDDVGYAETATATNGSTATGTGTGTNEN